MTYNFDADRWYENEQRALEARLAAGELARPAFEKKMDELERRYDDMLERLDGTYRLPEHSGDDR